MTSWLVALSMPLLCVMACLICAVFPATHRHLKQAPIPVLETYKEFILHSAFYGGPLASIFLKLSGLPNETNEYFVYGGGLMVLGAFTFFAVQLAKFIANQEAVREHV